MINLPLIYCWALYLRVGTQLFRRSSTENINMVQRFAPSWSLANQSVAFSQVITQKFLITASLPSGRPLSVFKVVPGSFSNPLLGNISEKKACCFNHRSKWMDVTSRYCFWMFTWMGSKGCHVQIRSVFSPTHWEGSQPYGKSKFAWWHETLVYFSASRSMKKHFTVLSSRNVALLARGRRSGYYYFLFYQD